MDCLHGRHPIEQPDKYQPHSIGYIPSIRAVALHRVEHPRLITGGAATHHTRHVLLTNTFIAMKKSAKILGLILLLAGVFSYNTSHAQLLKGGYFNVDWQFNSPVANDYANVASGWGMSFEGG